MTNPPPLPAAQARLSWAFLVLGVILAIAGGWWALSTDSDNIFIQCAVIGGGAALAAVSAQRLFFRPDR